MQGSLLIEMATKIKDEMDKFFHNGNKSAGTRARVLCQDLKVLLSEARSEIQKQKEINKNGN